MNYGYLYRFKRFVETEISEYPNLKTEIEEVYYKLLIKIAENKSSDKDIRVYHSEIQSIINKKSKIKN